MQGAECGWERRAPWAGGAAGRHERQLMVMEGTRVYGIIGIMLVFVRTSFISSTCPPKGRTQSSIHPKEATMNPFHIHTKKNPDTPGISKASASAFIVS